MREAINILKTQLRKADKNDDTEVAHFDADDALIEFIEAITEDAEIKELYNKIGKWYA